LYTKRANFAFWPGQPSREVCSGGCGHPNNAESRRKSISSALP
jgi:hypothetical protein